MAIRHTYIVKGGHETKDLTPLKAVRKKCLECSNFQHQEVTLCPITDCALYVFRSGKNASLTGKGNSDMTGLSKWRENNKAGSKGTQYGNQKA